MGLETIRLGANIQGVKEVLPFRLCAGETKRARNLPEIAIICDPDEPGK